MKYENILDRFLMLLLLRASTEKTCQTQHQQCDATDMGKGPLPTSLTLAWMWECIHCQYKFQIRKRPAPCSPFPWYHSKTLWRKNLRVNSSKNYLPVNATYISRSTRHIRRVEFSKRRKFGYSPSLRKKTTQHHIPCTLCRTEAS